MAKEVNIFSDTQSSKKKTVTKMLVVALIIAFVAVSGLAGYFYYENLKLKKTPQQISEQEVKAVIEKVGRLFVLPQGETPTLATVTDPALLKDQPFFDTAKKGDQLLIYANAKKAILYRPSTNQIVDVAPVSVAANTPTPTASPTPTRKP